MWKLFGLVNKQVWFYKIDKINRSTIIFFCFVRQLMTPQYIRIYFASLSVCPFLSNKFKNGWIVKIGGKILVFDLRQIEKQNPPKFKNDFKFPTFEQ